jgi:hypothetical protein
MARTIAQIQAGIIAAINSDPVIGTTGTHPLNSDSSVAIWKAWTNNIATAQWALENLFDAHKSEVAAIIAAQTPHTLQWYVTMAKAFQWGYTLPADTDVYAVTDTAAQIVSFAAVVERLPFLRIKVAQLSGSVLTPLTSPQLTAFTAYMNAVKDAGVPLQCTSGLPDTFQPSMYIYYDPQVMGADGSLLSAPGSAPVKDAINVFLDSLPFNGVFMLNAFIAAMQAVEGVVIADVTSVQAFYGSVPPVVVSAAVPPNPPEYVPDSGYMILDDAWFATNVSYYAYTG